MDLQKIANTLDQAALNAKATPQISSTEAISLEQAYEVQKLSIDERYARGEKLIGLKMGFTSKAKMEQMGVHDMIWGRLTDKMSYGDGASLSIKEFVHPRAEPEIAFLVVKNIVEEITLDNAEDYVGSVAVALEIIDSRYENFKFSLEDVVADNCSSAAFALGEWKPVGTNVNGILMSLVSDDTIVGKGNSDAILGNPWESFVAAARLAKAAGIEIKAGWVILAGAATPATYLKSGETISAHAEGLGSVFLDIK